MTPIAGTTRPFTAIVPKFPTAYPRTWGCVAMSRATSIAGADGCMKSTSWVQFWP